MPATIAGTQPDVAIGVADMDLAFRGAVVDLAQFPDFHEVAERFKKSALLAFTFRDARLRTARHSELPHALLPQGYPG